ncbi:hypothetical protein [Enterocloster sp.]
MRAYKVSKESVTVKKLEVVKGYGIADLLYVIRNLRRIRVKYEPSD